VAALAGAIGHLARGRIKQAGQELEAAIRFAPCAVLGPRWMQIKAAAAVQWAIAWLYLGWFSDRLYYRAFRAMWNGQIRRGRIDATVDFLVSAANSFDPQPEATAVGRGRPAPASQAMFAR
jgi:hypothetical protein